MAKEKMVRLIEYSGEDHDIEVIEYGLLILRDTMITCLIIAILGVLLHKPYESMIYVIMSMSGMSTMGGYHCTTRKRCFAVNLLLWWITISFSYFLTLKHPLFCGLSCVAAITLVTLFAPVEHVNKPLTPEKRVRNRKNAIIWSSCVSIVIMILFMIDPYYAGIIWINLMEIIISMLIGKGGYRKC